MSTSRDIERYAALFASRTKVMKSSAMRDLMAVTARPEVISLAGGLPDTSTFPPDTFAAVAQRIAAESCAKALQYGPTEGLDGTKACIAEVMAADERAYLGYHAWEVFYGSAAGDVRLPEGYTAAAPIDANAYIAAHPTDRVAATFP